MCQPVESVARTQAEQAKDRRSSWEAVRILPTHSRPPADILVELVEGLTPVVQFDHVITEAECIRIATAVHGREPSWEKGLSYSDRSRDTAELHSRDNYFVRARRTNQQLTLIQGIPELLVDIFALISKMTGRVVVLSSARDGADRYACADVRTHREGDGVTLHRDRARTDATGWEVAAHPAQLSMVLILQAPIKGGQLRIYNHQWSAIDDRFKNRTHLDYDAEVIGGHTSIVVRPVAGRLYLFNSSFFHEVLPTSGPVDRISLGFFLGFDPAVAGDPIHLWS